MAHLHEIRIGAAVLVLDDQRRPVPAAILVQGLVLWAIVMLESPHQTAWSVHRRTATDNRIVSDLVRHLSSHFDVRESRDVWRRRHGGTDQALERRKLDPFPSAGCGLAEPLIRAMRELLFRIEALASVKLQLEPPAIRALPSRIDALVLRIVQPVVLAVSHRVSGRLQLLSHVALSGHIFAVAKAEGVPDGIVYHRGRIGETYVRFSHFVGDLLLQAVGALE